MGRVSCILWPLQAAGFAALVDWGTGTLLSVSLCNIQYLPKPRRITVFVMPRPAGHRPPFVARSRLMKQPQEPVPERAEPGRATSGARRCWTTRCSPWSTCPTHTAAAGLRVAWRRSLRRAACPRHDWRRASYECSRSLPTSPASTRRRAGARRLRRCSSASRRRRSSARSTIAPFGRRRAASSATCAAHTSTRTAASEWPSSKAAPAPRRRASKSSPACRRRTRRG